MSYSIGLYFDTSTEAKIRSVWKEMANRGVSDYLHLSSNRPHFTLAIFIDIDLPAVDHQLAEIASAYKPLPVLFSYIGCFPSVKPDLFIGPAANPDLLDFHHVVNQALSGLGHYPDFDYYFPGYWVPHCAIASGIEFRDIQTGMDITRNQLEIPFSAQVEEIGLIEFRPVQHLFCYRLGRQSPTSRMENQPG